MDVPAGAAGARRNAKVMAQLRLDALRDLMRMEMPDRKSDVIDGPATIPLASPFESYNTKIKKPSLWLYYDRQKTSGWSETYQGAECLYLILSAVREQGSSALDFLHEGEIADLDEDGMPEILDAWGTPILFLRWAPGSLEDPGEDLTFGTSDDGPSYSTLQDDDSTASPDPFDPLRVYSDSFALYPLVVSAGRDGEFDIYSDNKSPHDLHRYADTTPPNDPYYDPADLDPDDDTLHKFGTYLDRNEDGVLNYADNITNHAMGD